MSDFGRDDLYASEQGQLSAAAGTNAVAALQAGHPFSLLLAEDDTQRTSALETLLDTIADPATRFARATNPLRARLTLERLLIQVIQGGPEILQSEPAQLIRSIAARRNHESRVVLVIEQAETLHPEVLRFFGATAALFPDGTPRLQILFVGMPSFRQMLDDPDAGFDEQTAMLEQYKPKEAEPAFAFAPPVSHEALPQRPLPFLDTSLKSQFQATWNRGLGVQMTMIGATLVGAGAITFALYLALSAPPNPAAQDTASALAELPDPGDNDPDPPALQAGPAPDAATAALRREFEAYLTASGKDIANATPALRRTTFNEFLAWRARTTAARPTK
jgi:hypothetical protein